MPRPLQPRKRSLTPVALRWWALLPVCAACGRPVYAAGGFDPRAGLVWHQHCADRLDDERGVGAAA
jgi:hypothetical protein